MTATKPASTIRTGWCGTHVPAGHISHQRCSGGVTDSRGWVACKCACHVEPVAAPTTAACPTCGQAVAA